MSHLLVKLGKIFAFLRGQQSYINYLRKQGVIIGKGCEIYADITYGNEPYLIEIGDNVRVTNGVKFVTHDGGIWTLRKMGLLKNADIFGKIKIGDNTHIGWNSIIMPDVTIGTNCVIGCGSVVTKNIPDNSVAAGVPARVIRTIDEYYEKCRSIYHDTKQLPPKLKKAYILAHFGIHENS